MEVLKMEQAVIVLCMLLHGVFATASCPQHCHCETYDTDVVKKLSRVTCTHVSLESFPVGEYPALTTSLNVSFNQITSLKVVDYNAFTYTKLLDVSFNQVSSVTMDFFEAFPVLESLNLSNNKMKQLPTRLPDSLKDLQANFNGIYSLSNLGPLNNLKTLYLKHNSLDDFNVPANKVDGKMSKPLFPKLEVLDLSDNSMTNINEQLVNQITCLKYLCLANNQISEIPMLGHTNKASSIEIIDLSNNSISIVPKGVFKNMQNLKFISLTSNSLTTIPNDLPNIEWLDISFNHISHLLETELKRSLYPHDVVLIGGNPLHCDCHLQWVKEFYDTRKYLLKYIEVGRDKFIPTCFSPEKLSGKTWDTISFEDFVCTYHKQSRIKTDHKNEANIKSTSTFGKDTNMESLDKDLALEVVGIGQYFVNLQWKMSDEISTTRYRITYHQFSMKHNSVVVELTTAKKKYNLRHLLPSTAYVICIKPVTGGDVGDCIEVVTAEDTTIPSWLPSGWLSTVIILSSIALFILLMLMRCWREAEVLFEIPAKARQKENESKKNK